MRLGPLDRIMHFSLSLRQRTGARVGTVTEVIAPVAESRCALNYESVLGNVLFGSSDVICYNM
jgi:hypothetical protein